MSSLKNRHRGREVVRIFKRIFGRRAKKLFRSSVIEEPAADEREAHDHAANEHAAMTLAMMRSQTFLVVLERAAEYQDGLRRIAEEQTLRILREEGRRLAMYAATPDGIVVGALPCKGKLVDALKRGMVPVRMEVVKIHEPGWGKGQGHYSATVEVVCVAPQDAALFGKVQPYVVPARASGGEEWRL